MTSAAYLSSRAETWIEDETNEDLGNPRNRIRHRVLPELDRALEGSTRPAISRAAALIREDGQWLDTLAEARFLALAHQAGDGLELDVRDLAETPPPIQRRVLLRAMRAVGGDREIGLDHVEAVAALLSGAQGGVDVPGTPRGTSRRKAGLTTAEGWSKVILLVFTGSGGVC